MTNADDISTCQGAISSLRRHEALRHHSLPIEILQRQVRALSINKQLRALGVDQQFVNKDRTDWPALLELASIPGYDPQSSDTHKDRRCTDQLDDPVVRILQRILIHLNDDIRERRRKLKERRKERRRKRELEIIQEMASNPDDEENENLANGQTDKITENVTDKISLKYLKRRSMGYLNDGNSSDEKRENRLQRRWSHRAERTSETLSNGRTDGHTSRHVFPGGFPVAPSWRDRRLVRQRRVGEEDGTQSLDRALTTSRRNKDDGNTVFERSQSDDEYQRQLGITNKAVTRQFRRYFLVLPNGTDMAVRVDAGCRVSKPADMSVSVADLSLPDHAGWLFDQSEGRAVWGVVVDMLFCVFEKQTSEKPTEVVLLPGCSIRPLVYKTAINGVNARCNSTTVSGIAKYQLVIDNSSTRRKHLFSFESQHVLDSWYRVLKTASTLDADVAPEPTKSGRRNSLPVIVTKDETHEASSSRYIPSSDSQSRVQKLSKSPQPGIHDVGGDDDSSSPQNGSLASTSGSSGLIRNDSRRQSVQDFRKRLRRDVETEASKPQPMKAQHFETASGTEKKAGPTKKLRSFGSLESLLKFKRKHKKKEVDETASNGETASTVSTSSAEHELMMSSMDLSPKSSKLKNSKTRQLSRSLDFGQPKNGVNNGLIRRASDIKDKVFTRRPSKAGTKLGDLVDISIHGHLQHKHRLRWQKLWCVVCRGCFYGFKSQSTDEAAQIAVVLANCTVGYVAEQDKRHKRLHVFKLSQENAKGIYLCASSNNELTQWLQALQMESCCVNAEPDVVDASEMGGDVTSNGSRSSRSTSRSTSRGSESVTEDGKKRRAPVKPPRTHRPNSCPPPATRNALQSEISADSTSTDDFDTHSGSFTMDDNSAMSLSTEDLPSHDKTLTHVWQNDRGYLFNVIRSKLRSYKKQQAGIYNRDLPGPDNEGLLLVDDGKDVVRKKTSKDVRRSRSFNTSSRKMGDDVRASTPTTPTSSSPTQMRKRHKPLVVKKIPAKDLADHTASGYMERKSFSGTWIKYWYVLHEGTLFCYLTSDDNITVDVLDLQGYSVLAMVDKFRGKRFVLQLTHDSFMSLYLSLESREDMEGWERHLAKSIGRPSSSVREDAEDQPEEGACAGCENNRKDDVTEKRKQVKQKLLEEMLRQKHELERKQAERLKQKQRKKDPDSPDRSLSASYTSDMLIEEQRTSDVTLLRQRRMSTQLKVDTIQKQLHSTNNHKRSIFSFGKQKKTDENKNVFLQDQLTELTVKLHKIDSDLVQKKRKPVEALDVNQNKHVDRLSVESDDHVDYSSMDADANMHRVNSLKATMQKWTNKTFNKTSTKKKLNGHGKYMPQNGSVPNLATFTRPSGDTNGHQYDEDAVFDPEECLSSDNSVTDLTRPLSDLRLDIHPTSDTSDVMSSSPRSLRYARSNSKSSTISTLSSPRREIDPSVLAEIDAFEEMTKQVLSCRSKEMPAK